MMIGRSSLSRRYWMRRQSLNSCFRNVGSSREELFVKLRRTLVSFQVRDEFRTGGGGSVVAQNGDTVVHASVVCERKLKKGTNFFPLTVHYRERAGAAGRVPKTYNRREFFNKDHEILAARMIDRSVRPLFPKGFMYETQIVCTVLAYDGIHDPEILALNAASAAIQLAKLPWKGPLGAVRVAGLQSVEGLELLDEPSLPQQRNLEETKLNLTLAGVDEEKIVMIETGAQEVSVEDMESALNFGGAQVKKIVDSIHELVEAEGARGRLESAFNFRMFLPSDGLRLKASDLTRELAVEMCRTPNVTKKQREVAQTNFWMHSMQRMNETPSDLDETPEMIQTAVHDVLADVIRDLALDETNPVRPDGRGLDDIRQIDAQVDVLPIVHGSSLFSRGDTQVLCSVALAAKKMSKMATPHLEEMYRKYSMLAYSFPPYAVNRTGKVFGMNRRMIGHGALAEKALVPILHDLLGSVERTEIQKSESGYPFTIGMSSEVTGSDGSTSMATVCGMTLALLDASIPIKSPAAGVSIGLHVAKDGSKYALPTDILGMEDHFGGMDFKVAGTKNGLTAIQLDIKESFITRDMVLDAIRQGMKAHTHIFASMGVALSNPRFPPKENLPVIEDFTVTSQVKQKLITKQRELQMKIEMDTGCSLSIEVAEEVPTVTIYAKNKNTLADVKQLLENMM